MEHLVTVNSGLTMVMTRKEMSNRPVWGPAKGSPRRWYFLRAGEGDGSNKEHSIGQRSGQVDHTRLMNTRSRQAG